MTPADLIRRLKARPAARRRAALLKAAQAAKAARDWRGAAALYRQVLDLRDAFGPRVQLAHMLKEAGELEEARTHYMIALDQRPDDADLNMQIGHFHWVAGNAADSLRFYERAAQLAPNDAVLQDNLRIGRERAADAPFQEGVEAGMKAMAQGRWRAAEDHLRPAYEAGRAGYAIVLAHAVKEQGRLDEAVVLYDAYRRHVATEGGKRAYEAEIHYAGALQLAQRFSEAAVHFAEARQMRLEQEGWVGSIDELMDQIRICIRQVHPAIDPSRLR